LALLTTASSADKSIHEQPEADNYRPRAEPFDSEALLHPIQLQIERIIVKAFGQWTPACRQAAAAVRSALTEEARTRGKRGGRPIKDDPATEKRRAAVRKAVSKWREKKRAEEKGVK
jgi:hypothetical protein